MDATNVLFFLHPINRQMHSLHLPIYGVLHIFAPVMLLLTTKQALGLEPRVPTAQELNSLPLYCRTKFESQGLTAKKAWEQTQGGVYGEIHHYCAGLNFLNRYYRDYDNAQYKVGKVVGELGYVINKAPPDYTLLPDVYLARGKALLLLKRSQEGMSDILKALELNTRSLRAYLAITEFFGKLIK